MQDQTVANVVDAPGVERAAPPYETVDLVSLLQEELGEIAAVLAGDPGDERLSHGHGDLPAPRLAATGEWLAGGETPLLSGSAAARQTRQVALPASKPPRTRVGA